MQWVIADGLGFIPEVDPETCHHSFDPPRRRWLPPLWYPQRYNLNGNLEDISPTTAAFKEYKTFPHIIVNVIFVKLIKLKLT